MLMAQSALSALATQARTAGGRCSISGKDGGEVISPMDLRFFGRLLARALTRHVRISVSCLTATAVHPLPEMAANVATKWR